MALTPARAAAQKAYKSAKKKRRIQRKAEAKRHQLATAGEAAAAGASSSSAPAVAVPSRPATPQHWSRIGKAEGCKKAVDRPVDEAMVTILLEKRSQYKLAKNYIEADKVTKTLVELEIVYDDAHKHWHTRLLSTVAKKAKLRNTAS